MAETETIVLNDFGATLIEERRRTSTKGVKSHTTISIKAEPLVHHFDDIALGAGPAQAIREVLKKAIQDITAPAAAATVDFRRRARKAYDEGKGWAQQRYRPLRGSDAESSAPPNSFARNVKFNDSGRLAEGLAITQNKTERSFTINTPSIRFDDGTRHLAAELVNLVPQFTSPQMLLKDATVRREIEQSINLVIEKARNDADVQRAKLLQLKKNAAKLALGLFRRGLGV